MFIISNNRMIVTNTIIFHQNTTNKQNRGNYQNFGYFNLSDDPKSAKTMRLSNEIA